MSNDDTVPDPPDRPLARIKTDAVPDNLVTGTDLRGSDGFHHANHEVGRGRVYVDIQQGRLVAVREVSPDDMTVGLVGVEPDPDGDHEEDDGRSYTIVDDDDVTTHYWPDVAGRFIPQ